MKNFQSFCLLLVLLYVHLDGTTAKSSKSDVQDARECLGGISASACNKRLLLYPLPRMSRRLDTTFDARSRRVFGLVKQPRVGRSDPSLAEPENRWADDADEDVWPDEDGNRDYGRSSGIPAYRRRSVPGEKEGNSRNEEHYLPTQRRDYSTPWAFFLVTPNFQNVDQLQSMDNLLPQLDHETDGEE